MGAETFVAGKISRFNRIGLVSFVGVEGLDVVNNRLVIDGAEQGNEMSITVFAKSIENYFQKKSIFLLFTFPCIIFLFN